MSPKLVITVDTEEDLWAEYRREGNPVENIGALPRFQELAERYGAIPTYLVNWAVADGAPAARRLRLPGLLDRTRLLNFGWLRFAAESGFVFARLSDAMEC